MFLNTYKRTNNLELAKQGMTAEQLAMVQSEVNSKAKSKGIAYAHWWFTGFGAVIDFMLVIPVWELECC
ncbi:hypothetical protein [Peribacillus simplex]|uniref:hypothetical protein n=1 Tax=Peribacillus simplex TaxID=1478 RepID=UPI0021A4FDCF|nr:hypothetical protein [Peribacillus simplex]